MSSRSYYGPVGRESRSWKSYLRRVVLVNRSQWSDKKETRLRLTTYPDLYTSLCRQTRHIHDLFTISLRVPPFTISTREFWTCPKFSRKKHELTRPYQTLQDYPDHQSRPNKTLPDLTRPSTTMGSPRDILKKSCPNMEVGEGRVVKVGSVNLA